MKLDYNPDAPLNLDFMRQNLEHVRSLYPEPKMQALFADFKTAWQLQLDLNQPSEIRLAHRDTCEKTGRKLFDIMLGRGIL